MTKKSTLFVGYLLVIASAFLFGCMPLLTKLIYAQGMDSLSLVFLRNALSVPMLGLLVVCRGESLRVPGKALLPMGAVGVMGCALTPLLLFASYHYIASGTATVLHFIYPALTVAGGVLFFRQRVKIGTMLCVALCVVGICLFYDPGEPLDLRGGALAVGSGVTYAGYILLLSSFAYKEEISGFRFSFWVSAISAMLLLTVCLIRGGLTLPTTLSGWLLCLLLALVINVGAVVLFQQGAFRIGGQRASILSTVEPITGIFVGWLVFQERIGLGTAVGSVLVILAGVLIAVLDMCEKKG